MGKGRRNMAAVGAAAFLLAGAAVLASPAAAAASTVTGECGSSVKGAVGDRLVVDPSSLLGLPDGTLPKLDFGTISEGTETLSKPVVHLLDEALCKVTATGIAPEPVTSAAKKLTDTAKDVVEKGSQAADDGAKAVEDLLGGSGGGDPQEGSSGGEPSDKDGGPSDSGNKHNGTPPPPSSPALGTQGYSSLPPWLKYGNIPMYSGFATMPYSDAALFSPAPGLRYGTAVPGYSPEFGVLGQDPSGTSGGESVQNAGSASALPSSTPDDVGLPSLLAVLAVAGAGAGLVRTWVLRRARA